jgi:hypothetical protein
MPEPKKDNPGWYVLAFVIVAVFVFAGASLWTTAKEKGWIYQDSFAILEYKTWTTGEYKTCTEPIIAAMKEEPQLNCLPPSPYFEYEPPKRFKVRFYGVTYSQERNGKAEFTWRCKKNEGTDPAFTCDDQKLVLY